MSATWNYRVVRIHEPEELLGVYEVYYDDEGDPVATTNDPILLGDTLVELQADALHAMSAFAREILNMDEIGKGNL